MEGKLALLVQMDGQLPTQLMRCHLPNPLLPLIEIERFDSHAQVIDGSNSLGVGVI